MTHTKRSCGPSQYVVQPNIAPSSSCSTRFDCVNFKPHPAPARASPLPPGFIPTSRLFRNQGTLAQVFLKYLFNNPPLATALPTAGTFMCEMVLGEEKGVTTGAYYCGPPDYQPEDEPTVLGFLRGLTYPQFKARLPSEEARRAQLGRRLWEVSESFVQETFDALDWAGVPASASTAGYAVELVERLAIGSAGTGAGAGGVVEENSAVDHKRSSSRPLTGAGGVGPRH